MFVTGYSHTCLQGTSMLPIWGEREKVNVQFLKLSMDHQARASIDCLQLYLTNLPSSIPLAEPTTSQYSFDAFATLPDEIEDFSEAGAVSCQLEICLGQHNNGPISF